jgi:hypothetical protein
MRVLVVRGSKLVKSIGARGQSPSAVVSNPMPLASDHEQVREFATVVPRQEEMRLTKGAR